MKAVRATLAIVWLALAGYMYFYYTALGKALGGAQYIAHMGQSGAAGAILFIGVGCLATAAVLLFHPGYAKVLGPLMLGLSAIFLTAQWGMLPFPIGIATHVRPLGFQGEYALFLLPFAGLLTLMCAKSKASSSERFN